MKFSFLLFEINQFKLFFFDEQVVPLFVDKRMSIHTKFLLTPSALNWKSWMALTTVSYMSCAEFQLVMEANKTCQSIHVGVGPTDY